MQTFPTPLDPLLSHDLKQNTREPYRPRPLSPEGKYQPFLSNEGGPIHLGKDDLDESEKKPAGCFTRCASYFTSCANRFPRLALLGRFFLSTAFSFPSIVISCSNKHGNYPRAVDGGASAIANILINIVYDYKKALENTTKTFQIIENTHRSLRVLISIYIFGSVLVCGFSMGGLTYDKYTWEDSGIGNGFFLILALCGTSFQRASGTCGLIVELSDNKENKSDDKEKILDKIIPIFIKSADVLILVVHAFIGIPIWLDMYTPKSYSGLNRFLEIVSNSYLQDPICTQHESITMRCPVSDPLYGVFAFFSLMHLIFLCNAARKPLQKSIDLFTFFYKSKFAQKSTCHKLGSMGMALLAWGGMPAIAYFSVHDGLGATYLDSRKEDPAGINFWVFDRPDDRVMGLLGDIFFTLVNAVPGYVLIPKLLENFEWFSPVQENEALELLNLSGESKDESKEMKTPLLRGAINDSYLSASTPQSNNINGLLSTRGKSLMRKPLLQADTILHIT